MSDAFHRAVQGLRDEVKALDARMQDVEASQKALARQADLAASEMGKMRRDFSNFLSRFDEVVDTLVQHGTDSLHWRAQVERRLDELERKAG